MRMLTKLSAIAAFSLVAPFAAPAQDQLPPESMGLTSEEVVKTTTTNNGEPIASPAGTPEIPSVVATFEPGGHSALHQHPYPTYSYVLEGEVEVRNEGSEPQRYTAGQGFVEALNHNLQVVNVADGPSKLLATFMGEEGQPFTAEAK